MALNKLLDIWLNGKIISTERYQKFNAKKVLREQTFAFLVAENTLFK